ncbi:MAG: MYXO-CTERM sorting domain-containing protein [Myxococcales bacterium]
MVARKFLACLALGVVGMSLSAPASAQVFQTDAAKTPLPQPVGKAELTLITDSWAFKTTTQVNKDAMGVDVNQQNKTYGDYFPTFVDGDAATLQGLFKFRGEMLDQVKDAKTSPGYFSPTCGFSGQLLLRGGDCEVTFGWYNVEDPNSSTAPAANEIYPFIPTAGSTITKDLQCQGPLNNGFCPLAWDAGDPRDLSRRLWVPKAYDSGSIKQDPRYKGKYVGFAFIGNPSSACKQTKYSLLGQNQRNAQDQPWVTTLIYQSTVDPEGFYMAFEDLAMSKEDWHSTGVPGNNAMNDGDFNDFVFYVSGISCSGGGQPCDTGLQGACSVGRTDCAAEGTTGMCRPIINAGTEVCDNVDNDCNGVVDDGDGLCPDTQVCDKGVCVGACGTGEFRCDPGFTCKTGHCIEDACADKVCAAGQACRGGECKDACGADVVCPAGQECQLGRCVDPCKAVTCTGGKVCERGLCVSDCACRGCKDGLECGADGRCTDPKCVGKTETCAAMGFTCVAGDCVDPCAGVMCPGGAECKNGACQAPGNGGSSSTGGSLGGIDPIPGGITLGGTNGVGAGADGSVIPGGTGRVGKDPGCACDVVGRSPAGQAAMLLGGLGVALAMARRRRRDAAGSR